jgi:hypothetical protein
MGGFALTLNSETAKLQNSKKGRSKRSWEARSPSLSPIPPVRFFFQENWIGSQERILRPLAVVGTGGVTVHDGRGNGDFQISGPSSDTIFPTVAR